MNDLYGLAPDACETASEMHHVLKSFGPFTGRYVIALPNEDAWFKEVKHRFDSARDIEKSRLATVLRRAREDRAVIRNGSYNWPMERSWVENAIAQLPRIDHAKRVCVSEGECDRLLTENKEIGRHIINISDPELAGSISRWIEASVAGYASTMNQLIRISQDIHVIDPYFDPLRRDRSDIFKAIISQASAVRGIDCVVFWVRRSIIMDGPEHAGRFNRGGVEAVARRAIPRGGRPLQVQFKLVNDEVSSDKLHARFLLTNRGAIQFDQGFQMLKVKNLVSVLGRDAHHELYKKFTADVLSFDVDNFVIRVGEGRKFQ